MIKLTIEANDIQKLLTFRKTRAAGVAICEKMKLSKYSYTGAEAKNGIFYYVELQEKAVKKLYDLLVDDDDVAMTTQMLSELNVAFIIQLIKKLNKAGEE